MSSERQIDIQQQLAEALHDSAVLQSRASEVFCVYPANTNRQELDFLKTSSRGPSYSRVRGNSSTTPIEELDLFASLIEPRYTPMPELLRQERAVSHMGSLLLGKNHVAVGSTHGDLFDVPADIINFSNRLRENNIQHRSAIIVSKGIDYLGVQVEALGGPECDLVKWMVSKGANVLGDDTIPARDALKLVVNLLYFSIPSSRSFLDLRDSEELATAIRRFNRNAKIAIEAAKRFPGADPVLLALGITGTKIKELDIEAFQKGEQDGITYRTVPEIVDTERAARVIGRISSATVGVIQGMYLFPTATNLASESPSITIGDMLYMDGKHDGVDIGGALVDLENITHPDNQAVYDANGRLPVKG